MPIYEFMSRNGQDLFVLCPFPSYAEKTPFCLTDIKWKKYCPGFPLPGKKKNRPKCLMPWDDPNDPFAGMDPAKAEQVMRELKELWEGWMMKIQTLNKWGI